MSGTTNTGLVNYISNPIVIFPKNSITVDIFGNTFYRSYSYGAGDDTGVYWNENSDYSQNTMLYFTSTISKFMQGKYSYGYKLRSSQSFNFEIKLPTQNENIDLNRIEIFIQAIKKLVIKDVVDWADKKIATTKQVINKK